MPPFVHTGGAVPLALSPLGHPSSGSESPSAPLGRAAVPPYGAKSLQQPPRSPLLPGAPDIRTPQLQALRE